MSFLSVLLQCIVHIANCFYYINICSAELCFQFIHYCGTGVYYNSKTKIDGIPAVDVDFGLSLKVFQVCLKLACSRALLSRRISVMAAAHCVRMNGTENPVIINLF